MSCRKHLTSSITPSSGFACETGHLAAQHSVEQPYEEVLKVFFCGFGGISVVRSGVRAFLVNLFKCMCM